MSEKVKKILDFKFRDLKLSISIRKKDLYVNWRQCICIQNNKRKGIGVKGKIIDWETRIIGLFSNDSKYWYLIRYDNNNVEWVNEKRLTKIYIK